MAVIRLTGVVRDGTGEMVPIPQRISLVRGQPTTIGFTITKADGTPYDLTGKTVTFAARPKNTIGADAGLPLIARQHVVVNNTTGEGKFLLVQADTLAWQARRTYRFDVHVSAAGAREQVIPESDLWLGPIVSQPTDPSSAP